MMEIDKLGGKSVCVALGFFLGFGAHQHHAIFVVLTGSQRGGVFRDLMLGHGLLVRQSLGAEGSVPGQTCKAIGQLHGGESLLCGLRGRFCLRLRFRLGGFRLLCGFRGFRHSGLFRFRRLGGGRRGFRLCLRYGGFRRNGFRFRGFRCGFRCCQGFLGFLVIRGHAHRAEADGQRQCQKQGQDSSGDVCVHSVFLSFYGCLMEFAAVVDTQLRQACCLSPAVHL